MIVEKVYKITLKNVEPLRIGGKEEVGAEAENPVARVGGKLAIPGSSLKGALRCQLETYLIEKYSNETNLKPCIPSPKFSKDEEALIESGKYRANACHYPCELDKKDRDGRIFRKGKCGVLIHSICPVCYLFGAQGLMGFVRVPFLFSQAPAQALYSARMDRVKKTVVKGLNFPYELVPDQTIFEGTMSVLIEERVLGWQIGKPRPLKDTSLGDKWLENTSFDSDKVIKEFILDRLNTLKILGGYKSKGFGNVEISVEAI